MKILAIEAATEACSVALYVNGEITQDHRIAPREHTHLLLPMIEQILAGSGVVRNDLDGVAFGRGPGAFTGVRIAASVVQGIAFGLDIPVVPVSTLAVIAYGAFRETGCSNILSVIDARMKEVYWSGYMVTEDAAEAVIPESVVAPENVIIPEQGNWVGAGSGWNAYGEQFRSVMGERLDDCLSQALPQAQDLLALSVSAFNRGETVPAENALPVYLRDNVAKKPKPVNY